MAQPLTSLVQPTDAYGGDEVSAFVLDPGYSQTRAGFAGEDVPKSVLPSSYGYVASPDGTKEYFGDDRIVPRAGIEVRNYLSHDSTVEDWDTATRMWENMLVRSLQRGEQTSPSRNGLNDDPKEEEAFQDNEGDVTMGGAGGGGGDGNNITGGPNNESDAEEQEKSLQENPLLMSEAPWNSSKAREKAIEVVMENWGCPAFWMSRSPVLAAFAAGKATALVVDMGCANASVTAVHDGTILKKSIQRSPAAGLWLSSQTRSLLSGSSPKIDVIPSFMIADKQVVEPGAPARFDLRRFGFPISDSFRAHHEERVLTHFKESVVQVWHRGGRFANLGNDDTVRAKPGPLFEFPDGSNLVWGEQRFRPAEGFWDATAQLPAPEDMVITPAQTIPELVRQSINSVDVDLRTHLLSNVVVTGGTSLVRGFNDRLQAEIEAIYPSPRVRIHAPGLTSERRFGAWIGGSILASLGTFHQMWISRKEYEENGPAIVEKRCK